MFTLVNVLKFDGRNKQHYTLEKDVTIGEVSIYSWACGKWVLCCCFAVEDVKCKFKNLRTVFNREYKAVQASRADKLYVSKWKHYQQLLFLCESCDEDDSQDDLQILMPQEDKDLEYGNQTPSSTLSSFSSSSTQTSSIKLNNPSAPSSDAKTNTSTAYQIFLSASPDNLKLASQTTASTLPASPSTSLPDTKPCTNPSSLNFSASGSVQLDSRPSTDSRCHWNEAKVQQLISFYSGWWHHLCCYWIFKLWWCVEIRLGWYLPHSLVNKGQLMFLVLFSSDEALQ